MNVPHGIKGLTDFLFHTKTGYCQQFAFAMAGLARLLGIPSRIAVGYTAGSRRANGTWKVTTADAHAWPELYFAGLGWIRFEPTPGGPTGQGTATVPNYGASPGPARAGDPADRSEPHAKAGLGPAARTPPTCTTWAWRAPAARRGPPSRAAASPSGSC